MPAKMLLVKLPSVDLALGLALGGVTMRVGRVGLLRSQTCPLLVGCFLPSTLLQRELNPLGVWHFEPGASQVQTQELQCYWGMQRGVRPVELIIHIQHRILSQDGQVV